MFVERNIIVIGKHKRFITSGSKKYLFPIFNHVHGTGRQMLPRISKDDYLSRFRAVTSFYPSNVRSIEKDLTRSELQGAGFVFQPLDLEK